MRIIFAGTPEFAEVHLAALLQSNHDVIAVYTQPDRPAGRGRQLTASAVKQLALQHNLAIFQPKSLRNETAQQQLAALDADVMVVVAYGLLLPEEVLAIPRLGCINVHGSLLPRWRGAAPIQHALLANDQQTGITIMQMDKGLDTGDILYPVSLPLSINDNSASVHDKLAQLGAQALVHTLNHLDDGSITPIKQNDQLSSYAPKINKSDALIDWHQSALSIHNKVRAYNPWPVAYTELKQQRIRIWQSELLEQSSDAQPGTIIHANDESIDVATGCYVLRIKQMQLPNAKALAVAHILRARADMFAAGTLLGL